MTRWYCQVEIKTYNLQILTKVPKATILKYENEKGGGNKAKGSNKFKKGHFNSQAKRNKLIYQKPEKPRILP